MNKFITLTLAIVSIALTTSCKKTAGEAAETAEAGIVETPVGTPSTVDLATSILNWEGAKPTGSHNGTINISEGTVYINEGQITGGSFVIDMNSITNLDLSGDMKTNLESHLKGMTAGKENDFFNVAQFPSAKFEITKVTSLDNDAEANSLVYGNLTIRDITKEIGFKANIAVNGNAVTVTTPQFTIDRTQFGVNYGSKTVFDNLGDKFINDEFGLKVTLNTTAPAM